MDDVNLTFIIGSLEKFLSASWLVTGIATYIFRLFAKSGETPLKFLSYMICEI